MVLVALSRLGVLLEEPVLVAAGLEFQLLRKAEKIGVARQAAEVLVELVVGLAGLFRRPGGAAAGKVFVQLLQPLQLLRGDGADAEFQGQGLEGHQ